MKIAVLVKTALDTGQLRIRDSVVIEETPLKISDIDRNAVEEAVKLKGQDKAYAVTVLKWGPLQKKVQEAENVLREALAMGLDEAYLIADEKLLNASHVATAKAIAAVVKKIGADLVLAGEATVDNFTGQIPARVAAELGWPAITYVRELKVEGGKIIAKRDLEDHVEVVEAPLPSVVSVTREINQPRIPTLLAIRAAMKKPVNKLTLADLGLDIAPKISAGYKPLVIQRKKIVIKDGTPEEKAEKLIQYLRQEGVI
ncbi:electron transfer flavoprotein subunit beta/FixA family protein [Pyrobaculum aerophilum]|uniref:Electron transfer flavoprotein subunit beta n=1 Tax=Pyrobaculum aerophilum TaxID=13773 RepID=A0A371QXB6_9CREN|nr:electron transfer flavoprotein subunit beta/FixA family protein [Pyrobaculum aerophilum]RFA93901.1 electron transfer flavoprotein subunit beta [Pyrobaculum aerophilum]RFA95052.1 electron transfer flavoprotein subunit beta [Pyrobaculum aerophilum]